MTEHQRTHDWRELEEVGRGVFRGVNERIAVLAWRFAGNDATSPAQFVCECGDAGCIAPVSVTLAVYEFVRDEPRRYLIAPNHEDPETETVIATGVEHTIVETLAGSASKIAENTHPRRSARIAELNNEHTRASVAAERREPAA